MAWPSPSDYQDAIQNPRLCFSVPELRAAEAARTPLGLPRVASGNFASVYEMRGPAGRWAVRCFLRVVTDQERRYQAISDHLNRLHDTGDGAARWLVDFDYVREGIRVRGAWYPIVKMDWVAGAPLHRHVEDLADQAEQLPLPNASLLALAHQWRALVAEVRAAGIAHNDYQHGNILVAAGEMKLVDYDGMFVPAFRGERAPELGRANYQHPARRPEDFGPELDNFSALVIYVSLRALAFDPGLWRFHDGENVILTAADYRNPGSSAAFGALRRSADDEVRAMGARLTSCCVLPVAQVPSLDAAIAAAAPGKSATATRAASSGAAATAHGASVAGSAGAAGASSPGARASGRPGAGGTPGAGSAPLPTTAVPGRGDWIDSHVGRAASGGSSPSVAPASAQGAAGSTPSPLGGAATAATPPAQSGRAAARSAGASSSPATGIGAAAAPRGRGKRSSPSAQRQTATGAPAGAAGSAPVAVGRPGVFGRAAAVLMRVFSTLLALAFLGAVMYGWWIYERSGGRVGPWMGTRTGVQRPASDDRTTLRAVPPTTDDRRPTGRAGRADGRPAGAMGRPPTRDHRPTPKAPSNAGAPLLREAKTHVALGQYSDALATLERARAQGLDLKRPAVAREYYGVLGRLRLERGEFREALGPLREALHRSPSDAALLLDYGRALEKLDRAEPARAAYRQVLRSTASPDQIAQARAGLDRLR